MWANHGNIMLIIPEKVQGIGFQIDPRYCVVKLSHETAFLTEEKGGVGIRSALAVQLLTAISHGDGSLPELLGKFGQRTSPLEVFNMISRLEQAGYIVFEQSSLGGAHSVFWRDQGFDPYNLSEALSNRTISVTSLQQIDSGYFNTVCEEIGIRIVPNGDLHVVLVDDYLDPALEEIGKEMFRTRRTWMPIKAVGTQPWIGPIFSSAEASCPCLQCLLHRLNLNDQESKFYRKALQRGEPIPRPVIRHPLSANAVSTKAIREIVTWIYNGSHPTLTNGLLAMELAEEKTVFHRVVKRPQCEWCGAAELEARGMKPIKFISEGEPKYQCGGFRTVSPQKTLHRLMHHVSPITGVVPYLRPYPKKSGDPIYNVSSGNNQAIQGNSMFWMNMHLRSANGGKGKSLMQAKVGALCEAIERYCSVYPGNTVTKKGAIADVSDAIHPNECMLFSELQYQNRAQFNSESTRFYLLTPRPMNPAEVLEWTPVWSLTNQKPKFLPTCYCYAQYPSEDETNLISFPDSNGCAAGNTLGEAILQGFLELVERDAAAIWWYNRIRRPSVSNASADDAYLQRMVRYYAKLQRSLYVLDITTDLGIPVYCAVSHDLRPDEPDRILFAFGAHLDARIALERSVIELNQLLPLASSDRGSYLTTDATMAEWLDHARLADHPYLSPIEDVTMDGLPEYHNVPSSIEACIEYCIQAVKAKGLETLVLDLTQPDIDLSVVKVMVPGLRHMWRRTAPGRLYDVPVKMGWLDKPLREEELNPVSIFI